MKILKQLNQEQAFVPKFLLERGNTLVDNAISIVFGVVLLSLLAQIAVPLPWTPVPITGQTFGVALMALLWGRKRAFGVILSYMAVGALGLPVFAAAKSGLVMGPTMGFLIGMVIASYWMGLLSDLGWTKTWGRSYLAAMSGSVITFVFGVWVLSVFIPKETLFFAGVLPFLPGDLIKTLVASYTAYRLQKSTNK